MIVVLKKGCPKEEVERLTNWIEHFHVSVNPIVGEETTILGLVGDTSAVEKDTLMLNHWVDRVMKVQEPFKLANRQMHPNDTVVKIGGNVEVGGKKIVVMAGPCSVESEPQICEIAEEVQRQGAAILRGGAWKPRSISLEAPVEISSIVSFSATRPPSRTIKSSSISFLDA